MSLDLASLNKAIQAILIKQLNILNVSSGTNPYINSASGTRRLRLYDDFSVYNEIMWQDATNYIGTLKHANSANRLYTFPNRDLDLATPIFDSITIENAGAGANPILDCNSTEQLLKLQGLYVGDKIYIQGAGSKDLIINPNFATSHRTMTFQDKSYTLADHADLAAINAYNAVEVANIQKIPMTLHSVTDFSFIGAGAEECFTNMGNDDFAIYFTLPLPTNKGTLKLYINKIYTHVLDADSGDKIITTTLQGVDSSGAVSALDTNNNDTISAETRVEDYSGAPIDCSAEEQIKFAINITATNANDIDFHAPVCEYYYGA